MSLKISRILHAGYVFEAEGIRIAFDPVFENPFSGNCHAFPDIRFDQEAIRMEAFSAVFISHFHDDHCSLESLDLLDRRTPIYLYCLVNELFDWIRELGFKEVHPLDLNIPVEIGAFVITPRQALDADVDCLFQIEAEGVRVLNVVDSWIDEVTLRKLVGEGPWDLILWPFQTMREIEVIAPRLAEAAPPHLPEEWIPQLRALAPRFLVPSSCQFRMEDWSWYNHAFFPVSYASFQKEIEAALPSARVLRLNPGVSVELSPEACEGSSPLAWVLPQGNQDVDYDYDPERAVPPTAEIAKRFPALGEEARKRMMAYVREELPGRYASLGPPDEDYFQTPRIWKLSLFDHHGESTDFFYRLDGERMELLEKAAEKPSWVTEVILWKLASALERGEALTSLYLRINDFDFEPEVEKEIRRADPVSDPLIHCLFTGVFASYQKEQLRKIRSRTT